MGKGSGNTRGSTWRNNETSARDRAIDFLVERIKAGELGQWGDDNVDRREMNAWEQLSDKERLSVLENGKYTGMFQGDDLETMNFYKATTKNDMVSTLQDELANARDGYDMTDTNKYVVKIKGKSVMYSEDITKPLTASQIKNIEWISANQGLSNYRYYAKDAAAEANMIKHMDFHKFDKGVEVNNYNNQYFADRYYSYEEQNWHD